MKGRFIEVPVLMLALIALAPSAHARRCRVREAGITIGILPPGPLNAVTDVAGVTVGHVTLIEGAAVRTGVTAILPHGGNIFQEKVAAAIHVGNGFGKLAGFTQVRELGNIETPIVLTNTLSVPAAVDAVMEYVLSLRGNESVQSVNPVVGETNDGWLNDIRGRHVRSGHVREAIASAKAGPVEEGCVGAGAGTVCFGFKGGIGTASRRLPADLGGWTVGVLVQTNFGGVLQVAGVPVGVELGKHYLHEELRATPDGSCMIVAATDAPLSARNLERLAKRAMLGLARTGGIASNGSGDYVIAFSTAPGARVLHEPRAKTTASEDVANDAMTPLFLAVEEAAEEAILNSLFMAETTAGREGRVVEALPLDTVLSILAKYGRTVNSGACR